VQLKVKISKREAITTGYGISWDTDTEQTLDTIKVLCVNVGFIFEKGDRNDESFSLRFRKK
jgi:hypothetical protein